MCFRFFAGQRPNVGAGGGSIGISVAVLHGRVQFRERLMELISLETDPPESVNERRIIANAVPPRIEWDEWSRIGANGDSKNSRARTVNFSPELETLLREMLDWLPPDTS